MHAQIAGGVICGAASFYITIPILGIISGAIGGALQFIIENLL